ncbi:MAG: penicillin-binding protein 2 [Candidatus Campbellbacteria bacterium]|nr:penicillin-binding protein 2 [Candidatus Campbellbacteria bacterium]
MTAHTSDILRKRGRVLFVIFFFLALGLTTKLYLVQVVHGDEFLEEANHQYTRPSGGLFNRGSIFFQDKNGQRVSAATLGSGFALTLNPSQITDAEDAYTKISTLVDIDEGTFLSYADKTDDTYAVVAHRLDQKTADVLLALDIDGVTLEKERWRLYPGEERAANTIGFVGFNGDEFAGRYGLEKYYERLLQRNDKKLYKNIFVEIFSTVQDVARTQNEEGEGDVVTTIEPNVQGFLEDVLVKVDKELTPKTLGGIIIDPVTGAIYALAILPTFNPNDFSGVTDPMVFGNPIVEGTFEMGSIMKPITMAAGLDAGVVTPDTTYTDKGFVEANGYTIWNYDLKGRGPNTSMQKVLGNSLNTGMAYVVSRLGNKRFTQYMNNFGLGIETGIDLPGEVPGNLKPLDTSRDIEHITAGFGQGIAVTPIAMVRALSALANGGKLISPHVVQEIVYDLGFSKMTTHPEEKQVIQPKTSETITRMLVEVVDTYLLGGTVKKDTYAIAAKTGTAQIAKKGGSGYYDDRFLHSFFGYFPAYQPRFLVFFFAEEPHGTTFASQTFTLPFMDTVDFLINYYQIPPDRQQL